MQSERRPFSYVAGAAWTIAVILLLDLLLRVTEHFRPGAHEDLVNVSVSTAAAYLVIALLMIRLYQPMTELRDVFALQSVPADLVLWGALLGGSLFPVL